MKIDFSGTNRIWMGVRVPEMGRRPIAKSVEKSSGAGREGHHLLGQSLRPANPLFAAPFGSGSHLTSALDQSPYSGGDHELR